jgi:hypothetical protein
VILGQPYVLYRITDFSTLLLAERSLYLRIVDVACIETGIKGQAGHRSMLE